ncbi:Ribosomal protein L32p [Dillenia turbinata]|uniref:Large ribosomal subunit protein bL32m n=1 Tax=Dillenia turbinata TaxID=194707 RepID=A0AAN8V275_9MAGN
MVFTAANVIKKATTATESGAFIGLRRFTHALALPSPLGSSITPPIQSPPLVLPEDDQNPNFSSDGSLELMAVPKKKVMNLIDDALPSSQVSKHKRGIRNGPKALKPIPVIIRCKSCGRVKLPHFYCCSGDRGRTGEGND